jgi:hypothetical protein
MKKKDFRKKSDDWAKQLAFHVGMKESYRAQLVTEVALNKDLYDENERLNQELHNCYQRIGK